MLQKPKFERPASKPAANGRASQVFIITLLALWAGLALFALTLSSGTPSPAVDTAAMLYGP